MWIIYTLLAVVFQIIKNVYSKKMSTEFSADAVNLSRFFFSFPVVAIIFIASWNIYGSVEIISGNFWFCIVAFAISQIAAGALLIKLFHEKNFAVSVTFIKSEALFVVILAMIFLSEIPSVIASIGIAISIIGLGFSIMTEKVTPKKLMNVFSSKVALIGFTSGFLYAVTVVFIKKAFVFIEAPSLVSSAVFVMFFGIAVQSIIMLIVTYFKNREEFFAVFKNPKIPISIGISSGICSFFWFLAFASTLVAYVKVLGQIESVFVIFVSIFYFKEKVSKNEIIGIALMMVGIILVQF